MISDNVGEETMKGYNSNDGELKFFRETLNDLESVYSQFSKICGLSNAEYWCLILICEGTTTQRDISEQLSLSRQTVNSAFKLLVKKGLVRLEPVENNLRIKQARLTKEGEKFAEKCMDSVHNIEEKVWFTLEEDERLQLTNLICKYKDLIKEALHQK